CPTTRVKNNAIHTQSMITDASTWTRADRSVMGFPNPPNATATDTNHFGKALQGPSAACVPAIRSGADGTGASDPPGQSDGTSGSSCHDARSHNQSGEQRRSWPRRLQQRGDRHAG